MADETSVELSAQDFKSSQHSSFEPSTSNVLSPTSSPQAKPQTSSCTCSLRCVLSSTYEALCMPYTIFTGMHAMGKEWGFRWVTFLFTVQWVLKGLLYGLLYQSLQYTLRDLNVSASSLSIMMAVSVVPWSLKPFMGVLADFFRFYGYAKQPHFWFWTILGAMSTGNY